MAFTPEQAEEIKKQLLTQVEQMPEENQGQLKKYIQELDEAGIEEFLKRNKIKVGEQGLEQAERAEGAAGAAGEGQQCIFCSITKGEASSYKIAENSKSIAILEINPLSKAHTIILPKEHLPTEKIPKSAMTLAQKVVKKIKTKFKPEDIKIETSGFGGHSFINIIPIYKDKQLEKKKAEESELKKLQSILETKKRGPRAKQLKKEPKPSKDLPQIGFRIP